MTTTNYRLIIKDRGWNEIKKEHKRLDGVKIEVGLFNDGGGDTPEDNIAMRGAVHEYGTTNIPQRPFMRKAMLGKNKKELQHFISVIYTQYVKKKQTLSLFLKKIGVFHESQIKNSIKNGRYKKLSPITIRRKLSSKPLIDTGEMLNSVEYRIKMRL